MARSCAVLSRKTLSDLESLGKMRAPELKAYGRCASVGSSGSGSGATRATPPAIRSASLRFSWRHILRGRRPFDLMQATSIPLGADAPTPYLGPFPTRERSLSPPRTLLRPAALGSWVV